MKEYQIIIGSPLDYKELVAYIRVNNKDIAVINKEDGIDKMKIEFFNEVMETDINLDSLITLLKQAKEVLI